MLNKFWVNSSLTNRGPMAAWKQSSGVLSLLCRKTIYIVFFGNNFWGTFLLIKLKRYKSIEEINSTLQNCIRIHPPTQIICKLCEVYVKNSIDFVLGLFLSIQSSNLFDWKSKALSRKFLSKKFSYLSFTLPSSSWQIT